MTRPVPTLSAPSPAHVGVDTQWTVTEGHAMVHTHIYIYTCIGVIFVGMYYK